MFLRSLYLHNFRALSEETVRFCPRLNFVYGENAKGKTSLLEAIHFLMMGRSFRTNQAKEMITKGSEFFYLEVHFEKHGVEQSLKVTCQGKERKVVYNDTVCPSYTSLLGMIQGVVVTPDDIALIKGPPGGRRQFLDIQIAQADPLYVHHLTRYYRAMRQRNHLLRAKNLLTIESWEYEMAHSAAYITHQRQKAVKDLEKRAESFYALFSGEEERLTLSYKTAAHNTAEGFLKEFAKSRSKEMFLGNTYVGPHRDDLILELGNKDVRHYASEGQMRSVVIALKFAEWQRLSALSDGKPLMLLDDVGIGLDEKRCQRLFGYLSNLHQVFLTATQDHPFTMECQRIPL